MTISDAYYMGYDAFHNGESLDMNPFDQADEQFDEWEKGYLDADAAESGEFE